MALEPVVLERRPQHYVGITSRVPMRELGVQLPPVIPEVLDWLAARGIEPAGPPFWKYNVIDMATELEVEVGVPVASEVAGDVRVRPGVLPGGRYVVAHHVGHPDGLEAATGELLAWADAQGLTWDTTEADGETRWGARLEEYLNGPDDQPDMDKWETDLIFRLKQD
jgi:effector-binding domain-containing protein